MIDNVYSFLPLALSGIALGWLSFCDEEPLPPLTEPTPWKLGAKKSPIVKWAVPPDGVMYDIVTEDRKHILFFNKSDGISTGNLIWDIGPHNDIPGVSYNSRLVPPRKLESEMTIHAKTRQQFDDLKVPEGEMYSYLYKENLETVL